MRCSDVMTRDVEWCGPEDTIGSVAHKMRDRGVGFIPVCDDRRRVIGVITDRDLVVRVLAEDRVLHSTFAREVMSVDMVACRPEDDLVIAERLMADRKVSRILCTEIDGRLDGVISLSDLVDLAEGVHAAQVLRAVAHRETALSR